MRATSLKGRESVATAAALLALAAAAALGGRQESGAVPPAGHPPIPCSSQALGLPFRGGRLVCGHQLAAGSAVHVTWDFPLGHVPNRGWRRWGTDRLLEVVMAVATEYRAAHPDAARMVVGDLSRPRGGSFGERFGGVGHASHQNGLDVDVYYPRADGFEIAPKRVSDIDVPLAQELAERFAGAGAKHVFVGPGTGLRETRRVIEYLPYHHEDHMHVRIRSGR